MDAVSRRADRHGCKQASLVIKKLFAEERY